MAATSISFNFSTEQLRAFDRRLSVVGKVFGRNTSAKILRASLKPTLAAVKRNAPVGKVKARSAATFATKSGKLKRDGTYDKGGATRRDARILIVKGRDETETIGLVGISKGRGKVGYRTHLITRRNVNRATPNDFLGKSERETESHVLASYEQQAVAVIEKEILRG